MSLGLYQPVSRARAAGLILSAHPVQAGQTMIITIAAAGGMLGVEEVTAVGMAAVAAGIAAAIAAVGIAAAETAAAGNKAARTRQIDGRYH